MYRFILSILVSAFFLPVIVFGNSVVIRIRNNSTGKLAIMDVKIYKDKWLIPENAVYIGATNPSQINPGETGEIKTQDTPFGFGLEVEVFCRVYNGNAWGPVQVYFSNPFVGTNRYNMRAYKPYAIFYRGGGSGSQAIINFELTGGSPPSPPPPPVEVEETGNQVVSGTISWNADTTGMPELIDITGIASVFSVKAYCPQMLVRNKENTGKDTYKGYKGSFSGLIEKGKLQVRVDNTSANKKVNFSISGLPDNIPVTVFIEPLTKWEPGISSPVNRFQQQVRFAPATEIRTRPDGQIDCVVYTAWVPVKSPESNIDMFTPLFQSLKNKLPAAVPLNNMNRISRTPVHTTPLQQKPSPGNRETISNERIKTGTKLKGLKF